MSTGVYCISKGQLAFYREKLCLVTLIHALNWEHEPSISETRTSNQPLVSHQFFF